MWILEIEPRSFGRTTNTLNCRAISSALHPPVILFFTQCIQEKHLMFGDIKIGNHFRVWGVGSVQSQVNQFLLGNFGPLRLLWVFHDFLGLSRKVWRPFIVKVAHEVFVSDEGCVCEQERSSSVSHQNLMLMFWESQHIAELNFFLTRITCFLFLWISFLKNGPVLPLLTSVGLSF